MIIRKTAFTQMCLAACLIQAVLFSSLCLAASMDEVITETETKAQTIYKFLQFVEFPEKSFKNSTQPITICVLGYDSFGKILDYTFNDHKVNGRRIKIIRVRTLDKLKKAKAPYHTVYITKSLQKDVPEILAHLTGRNCLVMGETPDFCRQGGMIQLKVLADRARFNINTTAVWQEDLKISSHLLKLATIVNTQTQISSSKN